MRLKSEFRANVLKKNARQEIENAREEKNQEQIARMILMGWDCVSQIQQKMIEKQKQIQQKTPNT
jgi:hypothetical protein